MSRTTQSTNVQSLLAAKVEQANARRELLKARGTALPANFSLDGVKLHEVVAAEKANAKRKAAVKAEKARSEAFARLGF